MLLPWEASVSPSVPAFAASAAVSGDDVCYYMLRKGNGHLPTAEQSGGEKEREGEREE